MISNFSELVWKNTLCVYIFTEGENFNVKLLKLFLKLINIQN